MNNDLCPICKSSNSIIINNFICEFDKKYNLVKCICNFVYIIPKPSITLLSKYYNDSYAPHTDKSNFYKFARDIFFKWKYSKINNYFKKKSNNHIHLDVGSGDGFFSKNMNRKKWFSFDYDTFSNNTSNHKDIDDFEDNSIDLITMWHSIEHMHDLDSILDKVHNKIKSTGYLFIACPNINSIDSIFFQSSWVAYDIPRHLYHFSPETLKKYLKNYNFRIINKYPMYQDTLFNTYLSISSNILLKIFLFPIYSILFFILILILKNKASSYLYICKLK